MGPAHSARIVPKIESSTQALIRKGRDQGS
jgi:hypothetical protein